MENLNVNCCALCFVPTDEKNSHIIDAHFREVLSTISIDQNVDGIKNMICNACSTKICVAFDFKAMCINTEDCIFPYVNCEEEKLRDLRDIYLKETAKEQSFDSLEDKKVCRMCMQLVSEFIPLEDVDMDVIYKYIPEVNFGSIMNPVICKVCSDLINRLSGFLKPWFNIKEGVKCVRSVQDHINMEVVDLTCEKNDGNSVSIKNRSDQPQPTQRHDNSPSDTSKFAKSSRSQLFICEECDYLTNYKTYYIKHLSLHQKAHKCNKCSYKTPNKSMFNSHMQLHENSPESKIFNCDRCDYKTLRKYVFTKHLSIHTDLPEQPRLNCDKCEYKASCSKSLARHQQWKHKFCYGLTYVCNVCGYESKNSACMSVHRKTHKSGVRMYKCDVCGFQTKFKSSFDSHRLKHVDPSEVRMYKCSGCQYQTRHKRYLRTHELMHKNRSEVQMYKCQHCTYETKMKRCFFRHHLKHKDATKVQKDAMEVQKDATEVQKDATEVQKDATEVQMQKCDECPFETKFKSTLKHHKFTHKGK